jgi:hypothetical protein
LAARLAAKKAEAAENAADPDAADSYALEAANQMPEDPDEGDIDLGPATEREILEAGGPGSPTTGLNITGLRTVSGLGATASRVSDLFAGSDSSDSDGEIVFDEDDAGRDITIGRPEGEFEDVAAEGMSPAGLAGRRRQGRDEKKRRPSTTEAKERKPLDDEDEDAESLGKAIEAKLVLGGEDSGPFADPIDMRADSSDEDEMVEIRPRRTS